MALRALFTLLVALLGLSFGPSALAHGMRSAYLEIREEQPGQAIVRFRLTIPAATVSPRLPCSLEPRGELTLTDSGEVRTFLARCDRPLTGETVGVDGLGPVIDEAVVWVTLADGITRSHVLTRDSPRWTIPAAETGSAVARQYVGLGVRHIATGVDHLLFLALLVLALKKTRAVLLAESAFALSHGLSFAATALGWIAVEPAAAEACIALSLVLMALDVSRPEGMPARQGASLALVFGAVHGLGFAGGLREVGLPEAHAAAGVLGFGAGVELGQLAYVLVALLAVRAAQRLRSFPRLSLGGVYAAGALSSFWLLERLMACVKPV